MTPLARRLTAAVLAGAATGARSFTGIGMLTLATRPDATEQPDGLLSKPAVKIATVLLAAGEYVGDVLPQTPSRLEPPGLASRVVGAAACGVVVARRDLPGEPAPIDPDQPENTVLTTVGCAASAVAAAAATAWLGVRFRTWSDERLGTDWVGALVEDAVVLALASRAVVVTD